MNRDLSYRTLSGELMDDLALPAEKLEHALRGLSRLNRVSLSAPLLAREIARIIPASRGPYTIADFGAGDGSVLADIIARLIAQGHQCRGIGIDMNPKTIQRAHAIARRSQLPLTFREKGASEAAVTEKFDVAISSLFLHHLSNAQVINLLSLIRIGGAHAIVMSDLERSRIGHVTAFLATRILSRSPIVHYDGPESVRAAFSRQELLSIAERAGLAGAQVKRVFPLRLMLSWVNAV